MLSTTDSLAIVSLSRPYRLSYVLDYCEPTERACHRDYPTEKAAKAGKLDIGQPFWLATITKVAE